MINGKPIGMEKRLARLEEEVREVKELLLAQQQPRGWRSIVGAHAGDQVFEEINEIVKEFREKESRQARRNTRVKK